MPQAQWSAKRERQYAHIKDSLQKRGKSESTAEEIAARTVNKERAQHGESKTANPKTLRDTPVRTRVAPMSTAKSYSRSTHQSASLRASQGEVIRASMAASCRSRTR